MNDRFGFICPHCGKYTEHGKSYGTGYKNDHRQCHNCGEDNYVRDKM